MAASAPLRNVGPRLIVMLENLVGARGEVQIIGSESKCRALLCFQGHAGSSVDVANEPKT